MLKLNISVKLLSLLFLVFIVAGCATRHIEKANKPVEVEKEVRDSRNKLISPQLLKQDFDQLMTLITQVHPEPYALISESEFKNRASIIRSSIKYPLSPNEFYLRVAPVVADIGDVHSSLDLPKYLPRSSVYGDNLVSQSDSAPKLFPLAVLVEESEV